MYITSTDKVMKRYPCGKCDMIFGTNECARDHRKNQCEVDFFSSFAKEAKAYRPSTGVIKRLLSKYNIEMDHYLDHFIC